MTALPLDLERYPIDDLQGDAARTLIERCREQIASTGLCLLPGFLPEDEVHRAVAEADAATAEAYQKRRAIVAYDEEEIDPALPADDPVRTAHRHAMSVIAYDHIGSGSSLRALYEWQGFADFLALVLEQPVFRCADPLISLVITSMVEGEEQGWHFDDNDFVVSLLLRKPGEGGEFQHVPMMRSEGDQAYERARRVFGGDDAEVQTAPLRPGTLALFRGRRSLHRVSPVRRGPGRLIALLSYDSRPGMVFPAQVQINNVGRSATA
jgi:hypothetical protein